MGSRYLGTNVGSTLSQIRDLAWTRFPVSCYSRCPVLRYYGSCYCHYSNYSYATTTIATAAASLMSVLLSMLTIPHIHGHPSAATAVSTAVDYSTSIPGIPLR